MQDVIQLLQKSPDAFPTIEIKFCAEECTYFTKSDSLRRKDLTRATSCLMCYRM